MTTIVIANGQIAADTCMVTSDVLSYGAKKIGHMDHPHHGEMLYGFSGCHDIMTMMISSIIAGKKMCGIGEESGTVIAVTRGNGVFKWISDFTDTQGILMGTQAAIGSGQQFALGALAAGMTPIEAVRIACKFDPWSRTPIAHMDFTNPKTINIKHV